MAGIFISFEGIDGAGKSTQLDALALAFGQQGRAVTRTREPGGTPLAEQLRGLLLGHPMDALTEVLLLFAARRDHLLQVIEPALARGDVVLCDRFTDATFAYQGAGRGFGLDTLGTLERWVQRVPASVAPRQPNLTFWFDLEPRRAADRVQAAARAQDRFESLPVEFFEAVADGYAARAAGDPARFVRIDANGSRHQVWQQITSALVRRGWLSIAVAARGAAPPGPAA